MEKKPHIVPLRVCEDFSYILCKSPGIACLRGMGRWVRINHATWISRMQGKRARLGLYSVRVNLCALRSVEHL